jgi:signal peptidase II
MSEAPPAAPPEQEAPSEPAPAPPSPPAPPVDERQPPSYVFLGVLASFATALDLITKEWATKVLTGPKRVFSPDEDFVIIKNFFELRYARNNGGAWSALSTLPEIWRRPFFLFVSTAASIFIMSIYSRIDRRDWGMKWGLPLALGGAVGNLVDRVRHGFVVDFLHAFIELKGQRKNWPTFNVADVWIVVGVVLMAISLFSVRSRTRWMESPRPVERADGDA